MFDLLSIVGKIRAGLGALGLRPGAPENEESVELFVRRNLGDEVFERLIEPFCSGVYAVRSGSQQRTRVRPPDASARRATRPSCP